MNRLLLPFTVFVAGFATMTFELAGSRVLGPFLGSSVFVWTSLIGIVMGSLSIGYVAAGKISEKTYGFKPVGLVLFLAALMVLITTLVKDPVLRIITDNIAGFRERVVVSTILLFAPASMLFGMILPFAVRIKVDEVEESGTEIGKLYALSSAGSIIGTFLAGFYLIPQLGNHVVMFGVAILLSFNSIWAYLVGNRKVLMAIPGLLLLVILTVFCQKVSSEKDYVDVDTRYSRVLIYDTEDNKSGRPIKMLRVNNEKSAAMFLDGDGLVFEVLKYYHLAEHFNPGFRNALMIGGSGYSYPKDYLMKYPDKKLDVVEIDPDLTRLAKQYFNLKDDPRLNIIHEDGRTFINRSTKQYDVIYMDAYESLITIPYQLTTIEAIERLHGMLNDDGVLLANIISSLEGDNLFLQAEYQTYKKVFRQVYLFAVQEPENKSLIQNIMLVALKSDQKPELEVDDPRFSKYLDHRVDVHVSDQIPILTDELAPVDFYTDKLIH